MEALTYIETIVTSTFVTKSVYFQGAKGCINRNQSELEGSGWHCIWTLCTTDSMTDLSIHQMRDLAQSQWNCVNAANLTVYAIICSLYTRAQLGWNTAPGDWHQRGREVVLAMYNCGTLGLGTLCWEAICSFSHIMAFVVDWTTSSSHAFEIRLLALCPTSTS